jgi:GxxExxY protein
MGTRMTLIWQIFAIMIMIQHKELTGEILNAFYEVYNELGYGFLERVYQNALFMELKQRGLNVEAQKRISVFIKKILLEIILPI